MRIERQFSPFKLVIENEKDLHNLKFILQTATESIYYKRTPFHRSLSCKDEDIIRKINELKVLLEG